MRNWQGKIVVDIREFYVKDGKEMPGKKGSSHHRLLFSFSLSFAVDEFDFRFGFLVCGFSRVHVPLCDFYRLPFQ